LWKISPNSEYQRIETNNPGQRVILLLKKALMSSEVNTTVEYGYCEEQHSLSLSLTEKLLQTK
jgi:hypothetical protein